MRGFWDKMKDSFKAAGRMLCAQGLLCLAACLAGGCMNMYARFPTTNPRIEHCYQCTRVMAGMTVVGSFPQMMSDNPGDNGFMFENLVSIPFIGLPLFVDTCLEAVVDTACLPADYFMARSREGKD